MIYEGHMYDCVSQRLMDNLAKRPTEIQSFISSDQIKHLLKRDLKHNTIGLILLISSFHSSPSIYLSTITSSHPACVPANIHHCQVTAGEKKKNTQTPDEAAKAT